MMPIRSSGVPERPLIGPVLGLPRARSYPAQQASRLRKLRRAGCPPAMTPVTPITTARQIIPGFRDHESDTRATWLEHRFPERR